MAFSKFAHFVCGLLFVFMFVCLFVFPSSSECLCEGVGACSGAVLLPAQRGAIRHEDCAHQHRPHHQGDTMWVESPLHTHTYIYTHTCTHMSCWVFEYNHTHTSAIGEPTSGGSAKPKPAASRQDVYAGECRALSLKSSLAPLPSRATVGHF